MMGTHANLKLRVLKPCRSLQGNMKVSSSKTPFRKSGMFSEIPRHRFDDMINFMLSSPMIVQVGKMLLALPSYVTQVPVPEFTNGFMQYDRPTLSAHSCEEKEFM